MPSRNRVKVYGADCCYHVYNRGVDRCKIFLDDDDYSVFCNLLKRYLSNRTACDIKGRAYPNLSSNLELLAFCLMPNHFHIMLFTHDKDSLTSLLRNVCTSYSVYFNKKYQRIGHLFQDCYKAVLVSNDAYFLHLSRYIHLNPKDHRNWAASSLNAYLGRQHLAWLKPERVLQNFTAKEYEAFLSEYDKTKKKCHEIMPFLANK